MRIEGLAVVALLDLVNSTDAGAGYKMMTRCQQNLSVSVRELCES